MLSGNHNYNRTLQKVVAVFGTLFNNLKILRVGGTEERVPLSYSNKQKYLQRIHSEADYEDESVAIKLPRMAFEITDISYDADNKLSRFNKKTISENSTDKSFVYQSVPYTIGMQLNVFAKEMDTALQIVEQILPSFVPEYTITIKDFEGEGKDADVPVTLNSLSVQDDYEGDMESRRTIIYTLDFAMKIKFFGEVVQQPLIKSVEASNWAVPYDVEMKSEDLIAWAADKKSLSGVKVSVGANDTPNSFTITTDFGFTKQN